MEVWLSQVSIPFLNPNPVKLGSYWHPKPLVGYPLFSWITKTAKLMSLAWFANPVNLSKSTSIKKTISQFINLCLFYYFCISLIQYFKKVKTKTFLPNTSCWASDYLPSNILNGWLQLPSIWYVEVGSTEN